jgi:hypothetical protein
LSCLSSETGSIQKVPCAIRTGIMAASKYGGWSSSSNQVPGFQAQAWTTSFGSCSDFSLPKSVGGVVYARAVRGGL